MICLYSRSEDNIRIKKADDTPLTPLSDSNSASKVNCILVNYSDKAVAVFGETRAIKGELKAMGGKFNSRLTPNGKKLTGWVFPKSEEQQLVYYFGLN